MRNRIIALLALALLGCGAATGSISPDALGITARDAYNEARTEAASWDPQAQLRYMEGIGVAADGVVVPEAGEWRLHYIAPGRSGELLVRIAPLGMESDEQSATSPPGFVVGDNTLGADWIDSPAALEAVRSAAGSPTAAAELVLVPTTPPRWVVRFPDAGRDRWMVDAKTGALMESGAR